MKEEIAVEGISQGHVTAMGEGENGVLQMMGSLMGSMFLCEEVLQDIDESNDKFRESPRTGATLRATGCNHNAFVGTLAIV
jgi:hypothetical protein